MTGVSDATFASLSDLACSITEAWFEAPRDLAPRERTIGPDAVDWAMERTQALFPLIRWLSSL